MKKILCLLLSSLLLLTGCAKEEEVPVIPDEVTVINVEITPPPVNEIYTVMIGEDNIILHPEDGEPISVLLTEVSEGTDGKMKYPFVDVDTTEIVEKEGYLSKNEDGTYQLDTEIKRETYISFAEFKLENEHLFPVEEPISPEVVPDENMENNTEFTDTSEESETENNG